jgi:proline dehydrogenase
MINFENTKSAFSHQSDWELKKAYFLFSIIKSAFLVKLGSVILKFSFFLKLPVKSIVKKTIFRQFCGGENIKDCNEKINHLSQFGIGTILDYSVEGKENDKDFEKTKEEIIQTILFSANNSKCPFTVFKITGLGRSSLIQKASQGPFKLNKSESEELQNISKRIDEICKKAYENKVSLFIDAEDSWYQDFIDSQAELMILKYNKDQIIIYNTIQLYRHDRFNYMKNLIAKSENNNCYLGLKLVRGAYMEKEREVALKNGYLDPIHATKQATDLDFTKAVEYCLSKINFVSICVGTHNELSVQHLTKLMLKMKFSNNDKRIYFAQLLGMSDHISFNLSAMGYNVAKYVPYGPIKEVLPYLIRRAEENTSVSGQTSRELSLIKTEIKNRKSV